MKDAESCGVVTLSGAATLGHFFLISPGFPRCKNKHFVNATAHEYSISCTFNTTTLVLRCALCVLDEPQHQTRVGLPTPSPYNDDRAPYGLPILTSSIARKTGEAHTYGTVIREYRYPSMRVCQLFKSIMSTIHPPPTPQMNLFF